jgi:hypothetical protein
VTSKTAARHHDDASAQHFPKSQPRRLKNEPTPAQPPSSIIRRFVAGENGHDRWDRIVEAAISGATLAAGAAIWLLVGYVIQRFAFRNQNRPTQPCLQHH